MRKVTKFCKFLIILIFLLSFLAGSFLMRSTPIIGEVSALTREFEENITIPVNGTRVLTLPFSQGEELELIFSFQVKQDLPIDVWFLDYTNYVRLMDGNEFAYFIDGSGQEITAATKVGTVTQYGTYELVFANYNPEVVDVSLTYDINVYPIASEPPPKEPEEETPLWQSAIFLAPVMLVVGILMGLTVSSIVRPGEAEGKAAGKKALKKSKKHKKSKKKKHKKKDEGSSKKGKKQKPKKKEIEEEEDELDEVLEEIEEEDEIDGDEDVVEE